MHKKVEAEKKRLQYIFTHREWNIVKSRDPPKERDLTANLL